MDEGTDVEMSREDAQAAKLVLSKWRKAFEDGSITTKEFEEHWSMWVPKIYSPSLNESSLNWNFNEELAKEILIDPLEEFIFNGDPNEMQLALSEANKNSSVCGRFFRNAEPTYSCQDCGMDRTCVLCVECFKNSTHRFHKYKMGTSSGGGCCDCGDVEAWKKDPFCAIHNVQSQEDESNSLPEDLAQRTHVVFEAVLWYAYYLLNTEQLSDVRFGVNSASFFNIDKYCTILYNDETHTFEQVISMLTRVLKCNQRNATDFVTNIDREGRAVVNCSSFQNCQELKHEIEKFTSRHGHKPLNVLVNHAYIVAHQIYATKLLTWLEKFLSYGKGFRAIFADVALKPRGPCIITGIMLKDTSLWKSARTQWHRLLIAGMVMEYENKKALAKIFTKHYGQIMKDFIKDDHDHSFSISSLSVQFYTVPTLAHHLIANDDVLYILLNTLVSECTKKCNKAGKLEFERSPSFHSFKRTLFILYDLNHLLSSVPEPEQWTDELRRGFLHGFSLMLTLLTMMQGMDAVTRQVGQHMEYEPEWESGFNMHIKLSYCIAHAIQWCSSDRVVLIKAYRLVLKKLEENPCYEPNEPLEVRELADHSTACLHYDVSSNPVSIHLPLTRLLAALHLHLEKYNLHFDSSEFQVTKPTPVQIIEPVLRAKVMIAQVHAGMWRRNGYSLLNTIYFYLNVKCRSEMLDRDIIMLQIGASLIESNEFLIHVLNKFNLINWALPDFEINALKSPEEESLRQPIHLVEEMLHLLIVIIGERYTPGVSNVTKVDKIKKEILQNLCIKESPHSELIKTVADELEAQYINIDDVIHELADFKQPTQSSGSRVYKLKEQYYKEYNVFFYHYYREELSKAEEAQRARNKAAGLLECCPPPKLPKLTESFALLVNLLQCDVMLHIMQTVCERCLNLRARSFSESQLQKVLYLIGYALQEEESGYYPFFKFIENATKFKIFTLLEELLTSPRVDAHKDLLKWTINKYKSIKNEEQVTFSDNQNEGSTKVDSEKARRAKLAAEKRAKVMAQMQAMQKSFIKENASLFEETNVEQPGKSEENVEMEVSETQPIAIGPNQSFRVSVEKTYTCILCQEEEKITANGATMVLAAFVHQATVLCQHKTESLMDVSQHDPLYLHANLGPAPHTSTCGHVMHSECWRKYFDNVMGREHRRPYRLRHPSSFDVEKQEFLCPLCECLSNTVLPLVPPLNSLQPSLPRNDISFDDWLLGIETILKRKVKVCHGIFKCNFGEECENRHCVACINASNGTNIEPEVSDDCEVNCMLQPHQIFYSCLIDGNSEELPKDFAELFPTTQFELENNMKDMIQVFAQVTYTRGLNVNPHPSDKRIAPMAWKSLAYTIHSVETLLRHVNKPLLGHLSSRQRDAIENLVRVVGVLGSTWSRGVVINSHALNLLTMLFENPNEGPSILQWDSFGLLISLTYSMPSLLQKNVPTPAPTGGTLDLHILRVIFTCHIVRILILLNVDEIHQMETESNDNDDIIEILKLIGKYKEGLRGYSVWKHVEEACQPFLRCCCLFYHYVTNVSAPVLLQEVGGDTFANMCTYLDLPQNPKDLFESPKVLKLVEKWCSHEEIQSYLTGTSLQVVHEPLPVPHLIDLPNDYSELINMLATFTCPNSEEDSRNPTMCLVCGEILCSQSYCCQTELNKLPVGACNFHATKCGAGTGIFLRVQDCDLVLLAAPHRGCFVVPPYLDDYGETDQGLRRGNPLHLCQERYKKLNTLWLSHSINEEIARQIDTSSHIVATQWNLL